MYNLSRSARRHRVNSAVQKILTTINNKCRDSQTSALQNDRDKAVPERYHASTRNATAEEQPSVPSIPSIPEQNGTQDIIQEETTVDVVQLPSEVQWNRVEDEEQERLSDGDEDEEQERLSDGGGANQNNTSSASLHTKEDILKRMAILYSKKGLSLSALGDVAQLIKDLGHDIPTDPRTILKTTKIKVGDKSFHHFSLRDGIILKLEKGIRDQLNKTIILHIAIDGIPIFKTNTVQMWPILCRVMSASDSEPFVVSVYVGKEKPKSVEDFLGPFLEEMFDLQENGINFIGVQYTVKLGAVICDAPARQFVKSMKGHNGYGACERCSQKGNYIKEHRCMVFTELENVVLRTDKSFRKKTHKNHHAGTSPFTRLKIDMISTFPLDYMHLVLLGVLKRLILIWTGNWHKNKLKHKLGIRERTSIDRRLRKIRKTYPKEFHRIPTSIERIKKWKAVELRSFLLYSGPAILKDNLSPEKYQHFLYLHFAIRILLSRTLCSQYSTLAQDLLKHFVFNFGKIYGVHHLIYNVHSLIHLSDECVTHGPLDQFSAFPFETYLGKLKKLIRSPNKPLAQIVKRVSELNHISTFNKSVTPSIFNNQEKSRLEVESAPNVKVNTRSDSFYLCDNGEVIKVYGQNDNHITGKVFKGLKSFYKNPMPSESVNIYKSTGLGNSLKTWRTSELRLSAKCWVMPTDRGCFIVPIIHHDL